MAHCGELGKMRRRPALFLQSARIAKAFPTSCPIHTVAPGGLGIFDADIPGGTQSGLGPKGRPDCFYLYPKIVRGQLSVVRRN
jgi:hypothetical protein